MNNITGEFDISYLFSIFRNLWKFVFNSLDSMIINFQGIKFSILSFFIALLVMSITIGIAFNIIKVNTEYSVDSSNNIRSSKEYKRNYIKRVERQAKYNVDVKKAGEKYK